MKGKNIVSSILGLLMAAAIAVFIPTGAARADGMGILGLLTCSKTGPGYTWGFFSKSPVTCVYNGVDGPQTYNGYSGIAIGVDLEIERQWTMVYAVFGRGSINPGGLAGYYIGGKASVTIGVGPSLQAGLVGVGAGFELVPLGGGFQVGGGFTGGLAWVNLIWPAAAAAVVPPPPPPPPPVQARTFIVFFNFDKSNLTEAGKKIVDSAAAVAKDNVPTRIQVNGYTDAAGTKQYNLALSRRRAETVRAALVADGVAPGRISTAAFGKENQRVPTPDGVREPQNRRVEILIGP